jgi:hypothetical protein
MKQILSAALFSLLVACASTGPNVVGRADPKADFDAIKTFGLFTPLATDRPGGIRMPLSELLASAVIQQLEARGMRQSPHPDVLVNVFVNTEQRMEVRQVPTASSYHGYRRGRYRAWSGYEARVSEYAQGTLAIDMIDPSRKMLVWEGIARDRLTSAEVSEAQVDKAVAAVFKEFPR